MRIRNYDENLIPGPKTTINLYTKFEHRIFRSGVMLTIDLHFFSIPRFPNRVEMQKN